MILSRVHFPTTKYINVYEPLPGDPNAECVGIAFHTREGAWLARQDVRGCKYLLVVKERAYAQPR
jgi:hypothetical protein